LLLLPFLLLLLLHAGARRLSVAANDSSISACRAFQRATAVGAASSGTNTCFAPAASSAALPASRDMASSFTAALAAHWASAMPGSSLALFFLPPFFFFFSLLPCLPLLARLLPSSSS
jgi:hypothetical protein